MSTAGVDNIHVVVQSIVFLQPKNHRTKSNLVFHGVYSSVITTGFVFNIFISTFLRKYFTDASERSDDDFISGHEITKDIKIAYLILV